MPAVLPHRPGSVEEILEAGDGTIVFSEDPAVRWAAALPLSEGPAALDTVAARWFVTSCEEHSTLNAGRVAAILQGCYYGNARASDLTEYEGGEAEQVVGRALRLRRLRRRRETRERDRQSAAAARRSIADRAKEQLDGVLESVDSHLLMEAGRAKAKRDAELEAGQESGSGSDSDSEAEHEALVESWKTDGDGHFTVCAGCSAGGNVVLCDSCPCVWHEVCSPDLSAHGLPEGDWRCPMCRLFPGHTLPDVVARARS